jgi:hypothetical protein
VSVFFGYGNGYYLLVFFNARFVIVLMGFDGVATIGLKLGVQLEKRSERSRDTLIKLDFAKERSSLDLTCPFGKSWFS